jgi:hypothetical protein
MPWRIGVGRLLMWWTCSEVSWPSAVAVPAAVAAEGPGAGGPADACFIQASSLSSRGMRRRPVLEIQVETKQQEAKETKSGLFLLSTAIRNVL